MFSALAKNLTVTSSAVESKSPVASGSGTQTGSRITKRLLAVVSGDTPKEDKENPEKNVSCGLVNVL